MPRLHLELSLPTTAPPSPHVLEVAGMFGLGVDEERTLTIVPPLDLDLAGGQIVFLTGSSGGGKSTLLRLVAQGLQSHPDVRVLDFADLPIGLDADHALVDGFGDAPLPDVLRWLSLSGLNDAFVMLRRPRELSDGQRYRYRLAQAMRAAEINTPTPRALAPDGLTPNPMARAATTSCVLTPCPLARAESRALGPDQDSANPVRAPLTVLLADEFGATLDRLTAQVLARNLRRWTRRTPHVCFVAATTHDDLLEPLEPDVLIEKGLGSTLQISHRNRRPGHGDLH